MTQCFGVARPTSSRELNVLFAPIYENVLHFEQQVGASVNGATLFPNFLLSFEQYMRKEMEIFKKRKKVNFQIAYIVHVKIEIWRKFGVVFNGPK